MFEVSHKNKKGSALLLVVVAMGVLFVLGTALLSVSVAETRHGVLHERTTQAHYISVSGAESMARYLLDNQQIGTKSLIESLEAGGSESSSGTFSNGVYDVVVTGQPNYLFVSSKGTVADRYERTNTLVLSNIEPPPGFGLYAIAAKTVIQAAGTSFTINGNIASNGPQQLTEQQLQKVSGDADFDQLLGFPIITYPFVAPSGVTQVHLTSPVTGTYTFNTNTYYRIPSNNKGDAISLGGNDIITFNTGSSIEDKLYIHLDGGLNQSGNSTMVFKGSGKVYFYVDGSINITGGSWMQNDFAGDVIFYVPKNPPDDPARTITFSGNTSYTAFIIAPNVDMTYNGGGSESFSGQAWVNHFTGHGSFKIIQDPLDDGDMGDFVTWPWTMNRWQ